jgi:mono/diheme cytochrome c family protein
MCCCRLLPILAAAAVAAALARPSPSEPRHNGPASVKAVVDQYCASCHGTDVKKAGVNLEAIASDEFGQHPAVWEKVVRKLRGRQMPLGGKPRPDEPVYESVISQLETALDKAAVAKPNPGRTDTIRRLTRTEYQNAVRDLLAVEIDATTLLPPDEAGHGFDNVTVGTLSPTLLDRYITAAQKISRLAVGGTRRTPGGDTIRVKSDITQEDRVEGLPPGTRGGTLIRYTFPRDGDYDFQIRLARDRNEHVEGLKEAHEVLILIDKEQVKSFTVKPPGKEDHAHVDDHVKVRLPVKAGPHDLGVTFLKNPTDLIETLRQPYQSHFNMHRHPRQTPAVYQVTVTGPYDNKGPGDTPSRRNLFVSKPNGPVVKEVTVQQILSTVLRRAYRRPVEASDVNRLLPIYLDAFGAGDLDAGIEAALSAVLVSREFLFRVENDPPGLAPGTPYRVSDIELASRLSFFLWASIPDDELLDLAERKELHKPDVLARQTRRMLADPRAKTLATNFAGQWLYLRNLDAFTPDGRLYPDFDDNLRQAMRRETELLFEEMVRDDQSILSLLKSDHTWLNERLAKHYGIPNVYGPRFRKVEAAGDRGGILRHGSVLTVTSYATRTSPVLRGKWVLENILGTPPPPPLPDVPALDDNQVDASLPVRERLLKHRANATCATCHNLIDPVGFAFEHYDALGRTPPAEEGVPVDAAAGLPDGRRFQGVAGLEGALLKKPDDFAATLTEKLLTYALGRGIEYYDGPAVREIVRRAKAKDFRFSAVIDAIVASPPFRMRTSR